MRTFLVVKVYIVFIYPLQKSDLRKKKEIVYIQC